jgi:hypothetical protein
LLTSVEEQGMSSDNDDSSDNSEPDDNDNKETGNENNDDGDDDDDDGAGSDLPDVPFGIRSHALEAALFTLPQDWSQCDSECGYCGDCANRAELNMWE